MTMDQRISHALAGPPTYRKLITARALLRELHAQGRTPSGHKLQPTGDAHRHRLVAARLSVRSEA